jgi:hypothetical protein
MQRFGDRDLANLGEEVQFCLRNALHPACTLPMVGTFYEDLVAGRRALGILRLLLQADVYGFACELAYSAQARRHYLARCAKAAYSDYNLVASRSEPLFDALAGGWLDLARDIAALSPKAFREGDEYEDDFCYAHFFHTYVTGAPGPPDAILEQFEAALQGASSPRLQICRALAGRDQSAFDAAFADLLDARTREVAKERRGTGDEDPAAAISTYVFVEGLAVLRVANHLGLTTLREYPQCPALARALPVGLPPADELPAP